MASCELHHFADASLCAYGACSYVRLTNEKSEVHCSLLTAKSRLAPIKTMSIPRLELSAAVLSVRLDIFLRKEMNIFDSSTFWSDSTAVLQIIRNSKKRFPVFVANRVSVIERHSNISSWKYVPSGLNPADAITRCTSTESFLKNSTWVSGPIFLWNQPEQWPSSPVNDLEILPLEFVSLHVATTKSCVKRTPCVIDVLVNRCSTLHQPKRCVSWIIRCKNFLRKNQGKNCTI